MILDHEKFLSRCSKVIKEENILFLANLVIPIKVNVVEVHLLLNPISKIFALRLLVNLVLIDDKLFPLRPRKQVIAIRIKSFEQIVGDNLVL